MKSLTLLPRAGWIALALLLLAGCAPRSAAFPTGTFGTTIPQEAIGNQEFLAGLVGDWQLTFTPEGTYTLVNKGVDIARGSYTTDGEQITFTMEEGLGVGPGSDGLVSYTWSLEQGRLQFSPVDDPVEDRKLVISSQPWTPMP